MDYIISRRNGSTLITASGVITRRDVVSAGSLIRNLDLAEDETLILDVDGVEDGREMFYHVAFINTLKKETEQKNARFLLRSTNHSMRTYLDMMGLERLFDFDDTVPQGAEMERACEFQRC